MATIKPLGDKVLAKMTDGFGMKKSSGGVIYTQDETSEGAIRPRWFTVEYVGPEQKEIKVGDVVLVEHGRWARGIDYHGTSKPEDFLYFLDNNGILGIQQ